MLSIVSTPIGNLEDISPRAIRTLQQADVILAERPRHSRWLLQYYKIKTPVQAYSQQASNQVREQLVKRMQQGESFALISDAGTPGVSDPGARLIHAAVQESVHISAVPGASATVSSLICSGFSLDRFTFLGYLPLRSGRQKKILEAFLPLGPIVVYESPKRVSKFLKLLAEHFPQSGVVIGRELTKKFESWLRGTPEQLLTQDKIDSLKGEVSFVVTSGLW